VQFPRFSTLQVQVFPKVLVASLAPISRTRYPGTLLASRFINQPTIQILVSVATCVGLAPGTEQRSYGTHFGAAAVLCATWASLFLFGGGSIINFPGFCEGKKAVLDVFARHATPTKQGVRLKVREIRGTHKATISLKVCWKRLF
jgi:hypothetical protein